MIFFDIIVGGAIVIAAVWLWLDGIAAKPKPPKPKREPIPPRRR